MVGAPLARFPRHAGGVSPFGIHREALDTLHVLIAGQALARGATLVTHDMREFGRVEGLRVGDWSRRERWIDDPPCA